MNPSSSDPAANRDTSPAPPSTSAGKSNPSLDAPTTSLPPSYINDKPVDDTSKLKLFLGVLRKFIGVSDLASVRFSLPAQLLEPIPNLEYWNYLDRPETFAGIPDSDDSLGRMLGVLRFWFTKDLKYVKGKPCKPYNSSLGEFFRCNWEVKDESPPILGEGKESKNNAPNTDDKVDTADKPIRVSYITEQTSHHPPVSAFWVDCPVKGVSAYGFDQLAVKFTGTSVRVMPGAHNLGIFVKLQKRDNEEYRLTHPTAYLGGLIRGTLNITVADTCYVTCPKTKTKTILQYLEESWLGKTQNRVNGVVFRYDPENDSKTRIKDVSEKDVLARIEGCWHEQVFYTVAGSKDNKPVQLIDLKPLWPTPKIIPPEEQQLPNESRRFWRPVTNAILEKKFAQATNAKQEIEERQRDKATARKEKGQQWRPRFFKQPLVKDGRPELTSEGQEALRKLQEQHWQLEESETTGA